MTKEAFIFTRECWTGDSRDGVIINGEGSHFFRMTPEGKILEAYEVYENDEGSEVISLVPEMLNVSWIDDLGFEDFEALDMVSKDEFEKIKKLHFQTNS
jgi:hypothetical protein